MHDAGSVRSNHTLAWEAIRLFTHRTFPSPDTRWRYATFVLLSTEALTSFPHLYLIWPTRGTFVITQAAVGSQLALLVTVWTIAFTRALSIFAYQISGAIGTFTFTLKNRHVMKQVCQTCV